MRKESIMALSIIALLLSATFVVFVRAYNPTDNDANTGNDASDTLAGATYIVPGNYTGNLTYPTPYVDTQDFYKFFVYNGHRIYVEMTPNTESDYNLELYDPSGTLIPPSNGSGIGQKENYELTAYVEGNWTIRVSIGTTGTGRYWFYITPVNHSPATPAAPSGNTTGYVYTQYTYSTVTTDLDNDNLNYTFDWGDTTTNTVGPYQSNTTAYASHQWTKPITYNIIVKAQDNHGLWSGWSTTTSITLGQNDDSRGVDAANSSAYAHYVNSTLYYGITYNSNGTLYQGSPKDQDYINFTASNGDHIRITMTPPQGANFDLELDAPNGDYWISSNPSNQMETIEINAPATGNYAMRFYIVSGEGFYDFTLGVNSAPRLIIGVSESPDEGVRILIDGVTYRAWTYAPVNITLPAGNHTLQALGFIIWDGDVAYLYRFDHWSDGVRTNPRTINLTQDKTLTAYFIPGHPIYPQ